MICCPKNFNPNKKKWNTLERFWKISYLNDYRSVTPEKTLFEDTAVGSRATERNVRGIFKNCTIVW